MAITKKELEAMVEQQAALIAQLAGKVDAPDVGDDVGESVEKLGTFAPMDCEVAVERGKGGKTETITVASVAELRNGKQSLYVSIGGRKVPAAYLLPILRDADICSAFADSIESGMAAQPAKFRWTGKLS